MTIKDILKSELIFEASVKFSVFSPQGYYFIYLTMFLNILHSFRLVLKYF